MIFVCGIHGVGKTYYCKKMEVESGKAVYSASNLIMNKRFQSFKEKKVSGILENQKILINEVNCLRKEIGDFILDGHLCLIDEKKGVIRLPLEVFEALNINELIVLIDGAEKIKKRIRERDGIDWDVDFINEFQNEEIQYAYKIAKKLRIDLKIVSNLDEENNGNNCFGKNIVLPIKPIFAKQILCNKKKYEFRKKLCIANVDKIYLYATMPTKCIVGEVEVCAKLIMEKSKLWNVAEEFSGISLEYYENYFRDTQMGSAYFLGKAQRYDRGITLADVGISYPPQSFVYVDDLKVVRK